ncbi:MAG: alpha/beta fold hydrolase [Candidatus Aminicenantes bacterium]|nr:alpha/beta fold hydrolase [Candidatus Aminicenantes bacterium]
MCAILSNPMPDKGKPIIILCHGFTTGKDGNTYTRLENILNENGISSFRFDFFGHGESEGKFEEVTTSEAVDDILNAIRFLKDSGYRKMGLVGSSFGGLASIIAASNTADLYVLALKSPVSDYSDMSIAQQDKQQRDSWKEKGFIYFTNGNERERRLNYSFCEDAEKIKGYESARKIKLPALIVHGDKDETVPVEQSKKTASLIENCRLEIIEGADHGYSNPKHFEKMLDLISQFIINNS